jgi:hypothetical protein
MIELVKKAVERTVKQFQEHHLDFLSERDIQAWLFAELRLRDATSNLRYPYDDAEGVNRRFGFPDHFCIHPVTTEYYPYERKQVRFDIAVLSDNPDPKSAIWHQPCRVAIEIKLRQPGYGQPRYPNDVTKLQNYQKYLQNNFTEERTFTGIAMLFVHPYGTAKPTAVTEEKFGDAYPENGVVLHLVTDKVHWWKQCPGPSITE